MPKANYKKKIIIMSYILTKLISKIPISYNGLKISDEMIEELISKYEDGSLDFHCKGEKVTEDEITKLIKTQNNVLLNTEVKNDNGYI